MSEATRRPWQRPQLSILARSNSEESVLTACKMAGIQGLAPNNVYGLCWTIAECAHCAVWAPS